MHFDIIPIQISSLNYCIFGHGVLGTTRAVLLRSAPQKHQVESRFRPLLLRPSVDVTAVAVSAEAAIQACTLE